MKKILFFALSAFLAFSIVSGSALAKPSHDATSLLDKFDTWKDFYNSNVDSVFAKYPVLGNLAGLYPSFKVAVTADSETVYLQIKDGKIKKVSDNGNGKFEADTAMSVIDSLLSAKTVPQIKERFYDAYDDGKIKLSAHNWKDSIIMNIALWIGRRI